MDNTDSADTPGRKLPEMVIIKSEDVPRELWDTARREAQRYSVGLLAIQQFENDENAQLIGTGTLIKYKTSIAILTAKHVVLGKAFVQCTSIGLVFEKSRRFVIPKCEYQVRYLHRIDVALIIIYSNNTEWISAEQSFVSVEKYYEGRTDEQFPGNKWFRLLFGFPEEKSKMIPAFKRFKSSFRFLGLSYFSTVCGTERRDTHDELLVAADLSKEHGISGPEGCESGDILPRDFGGVSGGGLWKVILITNEKSKLIFDRIIFEGIAFYQTPLVDMRREIKCTSVRGIWENLAEILHEFSH
jgi:hypothetical protein